MPAVIHQRVESVILFPKFFRRAANTLDLGDVNLQERDSAVVLFFFAFLLELLCSGKSGIGLAGAEKDMKTFAS